MEELITIKDLVVGYELACNDTPINIVIEKGDFVCISGPNGRGKSTLVKTILGFIPPKKGEVVVSNLVSFGYLPQSFSCKDFPASVMEVVLSGRLTSSLFYKYSTKDKDYAIKCMEMTGVSDLKPKLFNTLSGGQKQRVLLARALCGDCNVLVLDEPANNLDKESVTALHKILRILNNEETCAKTIIMITHEKKPDFIAPDKLKVIDL